MSAPTAPVGVGGADADAAARQARALEVSGWGERFTFLQPHNLCFWVFLGLMAVGLFQSWSYFRPELGFYGEAIGISAVLCVGFGAIWWAWLRHVDRWERQPVDLVVAAVAWGAIAATFGFAMTVNTAMLSIYAKLFGQDWASSWAAGATAPFTEESAKLCGFLLLMGLAPRLVRTANDGLVLGAFIGLGFAAFEDFLYAANAVGSAFGTDPVQHAVQISFTRFAVGFVSHPLFSALVCSGAVYLIGTAAQPRRIARGLLFVAAGLFIHFTWDDAGGLGGHGAGVFLVMALSTIAGFVLLTIAFRLAAPTEHQFVRDILAPEVEAGHVRADELDAALDRRARKAAKKAASGRKAKKAQKHLGQAIMDLAHDVARARGLETAEVEQGRAEVARLRSVAEVR
ncbi:PrsW family intramembrane metalloprotease [Nocardioides sp. NPDC059952]|uniref:PrsW family intramembrane metalloprotease n=1 Tax=Nocardioides sp. NPDC059952 TaxID=3347014 RepID=UPI003657FE2E